MTANRRIRLLFLIFLLQTSLALAMFSTHYLNSLKDGQGAGLGGTKTPAMDYRISPGSRVLKRFTFDSADSLKNWEEKIFRKKTIYTVMKETGRGFLNSASAGSSSGSGAP